MTRRVLVVASDPADAASAQAVLVDADFEVEVVLGAVGPGARHDDPASTRYHHLQRLATLGTLAASTAHEMGNILTRLLASLRRLASERDPVALSSAMSCAVQLRDMARETTSFARARSVDRSAVQVGLLLEQALRLVEHRIGHAKIEREIAEDLPPIWADSRRLRQVLVNLLTNAADAIDDAGVGPGRIRVSARIDEQRLRIDVEDSGTGIPAEDLARVFDMFYTTKGGGAGTGIGLPVTREIVLAHGGEISVSTEVGSGSCFSVFLPVRRS